MIDIGDEFAAVVFDTTFAPNKFGRHFFFLFRPAIHIRFWQQQQKKKSLTYSDKSKIVDTNLLYGMCFSYVSQFLLLRSAVHSDHLPFIDFSSILCHCESGQTASIDLQKVKMYLNNWPQETIS